MGDAALRGICPIPFYQESLFPSDDGFTLGRFCFPEPSLNGTRCCVPCPTEDWLYPDNFDSLTLAADWVSVVATVCLVFLILSFTFLPIDKTYRHYLSVCLVVSVIFMELGFLIPLGAEPDQCYNQITPNDMHTNVPCAVSGAFIIAGGWCGVMWVFIRALSLHLQICWQVIVGKSFMIGAMAAGWGIPAIGLTVAMAFSGVSFRLGDTCHINHNNSLADFWIPLLVFAGLTVFIQFATFGYCIKVYLASLADNSSTTNNSSLPSYPNSVRTLTPRQAYRRVRRVIELQWRSILLVIIIAADVILFSVVFVYLDHTEMTVASSTKAVPWLTCLVQNGGDKNKCLSLASELTLSEATTEAVLLLLAMNGVWLMLLMIRKSMITGWYELVKGHLKPTQEFVSVDAHTYGGAKDRRSYEMISTAGRDMPQKFPEPVVRSTTPETGRLTPDFFHAQYVLPNNPYHAPRAPDPVLQWNAELTFAPPQRSYADPPVHPLHMNQM